MVGADREEFVITIRDRVIGIFAAYNTTRYSANIPRIRLTLGAIPPLRAADKGDATKRASQIGWVGVYYRLVVHVAILLLRRAAILSPLVHAGH